MTVARALVLALLLASAAQSSIAQAQTPPPAPPPVDPPSAAPPPAAPAPPAPAPAAPPSIEPPTRDAARADALFQDGKRLLEQGSFEAACTLLAQSDAADPTVGALGLLAACHEQQGRLATAWKEYRETVRRADAAHDARADFARQRADALEPRLPKLLLQVAEPLADLELRRNQEVVPAAELGLPIPVDPGTYEIVARAPGRSVYRVTVTAREGAVTTVQVPALAPIGADPEAARLACTPTPAPQAATGGLGARLPAGLAAGAVGLAGIGLGVAFGVSAAHQNAASGNVYTTCTSGRTCAQGRDLRDGAFQAATVSTVGFVVGGAGVAAGAALLLWPTKKAPRPDRTGHVHLTPFLGPTGGGALIGGAF